MLDVFEIPSTGASVSSVIWMHGLGASNRDFEEAVEILDTPGIRYLFPAAPSRKVTINGGMEMPAWYDILSFSAPPLRGKAEDVRTASEQIAELIEREQARGIPAERIVLAGFSQGAAMALHVGLCYPKRLAGVLVLSGYLVLPSAFEQERSPANAHTPFLFCHGSADTVVPVALGRSAFQLLQAAKYTTEFREFPMAHSLCLPEINTIKHWLQTVLPAQP